MGPKGALPNRVVRGEAGGARPPRRPGVFLRLAAALLIGVGVSRLLGWMGDILGLSPAAAARRAGLGGAAVLAALAGLTLWARRRNRFAKACSGLMPLLESDADAYIAGYEALRKQWRGIFYRRYICLNLAAGYHSRGELDTALERLHEAAACRLPGTARTVWAADLAMNAFCREKWAEGLAVMEREEKALSAMASLEDGRAPAAWWLLCLYRLIARGELEKAREVLPQAEEQLTGLRTRKSLDHIREVLARPEPPGGG